MSRYPVTYSKQPLMFAALAAQKNSYSLYLLSATADSNQEQILKHAYAQGGRTLDIGKCCLRFRKLDDLLTEPVERLIAGSSVATHIERYEDSRRK